jgi:hypothetical protein
VLLVAALVWTFVIEPRRLQVTSVMVPEGGASGGGNQSRPPGPQSVTVGTRLELLRSLERMEADLAEMRSEVERMRAHLRARESEGARRHSE